MSFALSHILNSLSRQIEAQPANISLEINNINNILDDNNEVLATADLGNIHKMATGIIKNRICNSEWLASGPSKKWIMSLLRIYRLILKEKSVIDQFHSCQLHSQYVQFSSYILKRFEEDENEFLATVSMLLNVTQKLVTKEDFCHRFVEARLHKMILKFLNIREMTVLQRSLEVQSTYSKLNCRHAPALTYRKIVKALLTVNDQGVPLKHFFLIIGRLCDWSATCRTDLCASTAIDLCLQLISTEDLLTQKLCVSLLRILACEEQAKQQIHIYDGLPILIGLLSLRNCRLQWHIAWCLAQLAEDQERCHEIGQLGAIQLLFQSISDAAPPERGVIDWITMLTGHSALLSQLCHSDSNQQIMVQCNGVYHLGRILLLPRKYSDIRESPAIVTLQCSTFRVLRLLYSLERNRRIFKKVFEPKIFEVFIDIGHYIHELSAYSDITRVYTTYLDTLDEVQLSSLWHSSNLKRDPIGSVTEFDFLEQLGAGAFGCVYLARKTGLKDAIQYFAVKEIFMVQYKEEDRDKSFGDIISEVKIIKQQLRHPNIVRYRKIFVENSRLYIVMDLIEGASLKEHITSVKEKRERFTEDRIWYLLIQLILALRYLHKEKQIIHRDLKPNNIMISDNDRLVVTDFGLAKQKGTDYLKSAAGTITYSCPEIVQNEPYGEKADIWSLGCCLYEIMQLKPAFSSQNMLQLATQIVEGTYEELDQKYSKNLGDVVTKCLCTSTSQRPDIHELSGNIGPKLLVCLDDLLRSSKPQTEERETTSSQSRVNSSSSSLNSSLNISSATVFDRRPKVPTRPQITTTLSIDKPQRNKGKSQSAGSSTRQMANSVSLPRINNSQNNNIQMQNTIRSNRRLTLISNQRMSEKRASSSECTARKKKDSLTIRSAAIHPVTDPVLSILQQIQQVLIITSGCSVTETVNHKRRLIEQFKRAVFSMNSTPEDIKRHFRAVNREDKNELFFHLLSSESTDKIDLDLSFADFRPVLSEMHLTGYGRDEKVTEITYEQLFLCIQQLKEDYITP